MSNTSSLEIIFKKAELFQVAQAHAEANRAEMGDQWADEIIEDFRAQGLLEVQLYMSNVTATGEARAKLEANLVKNFN